MKYFQARGIVAVLYSEGTYAVYQRNSLTVPDGKIFQL